MPTFVLMTKLSPELLGDPRGRRAVGKEWLKKVSSHCAGVHWLKHYALLGRYDFMDIYDAPDFETAHRVSYISRAEGAVEAESWQALPYERYVELVEDLDE
jgi:uncharacterized protein with GYD domain